MMLLLKKLYTDGFKQKLNTVIKKSFYYKKL